MDVVKNIKELDPVYQCLIGIELCVTLWFGIFSWPFLVMIVFPVLVKIYLKWSCGKTNTSRRLEGKVAIVTGANIGIGYETAKDFARRDAKVILACRNMEKGKQAVEEIQKETGNISVFLMKLDLSSMKSVREFCKKFLSEQKRLDILVNNAGAETMEKNFTQDGLELNMAANHLGPFLLTNILLDLMKTTGGARIVMVSSMGHAFPKTFDLDDLNSEKTFQADSVYCKTKLANVLMTRELDCRFRVGGITQVTVNALHPGMVKTAFLRNANEITWRRIINRISMLFAKTPEEGAQTQIHLAVADEVEGLSGRYWADCLETSISPLAQNTNLAKDLWDISTKLVNLKSSETIF